VRLWSEIWLLVDRIGSPSFAGCQVFTLGCSVCGRDECKLMFGVSIVCKFPPI
jgi:hypothetical protein